MMLASLLSASLMLGFAQTPPELKPIGHINCPEITEGSGIAKSHRHKGVYWVENDSGDTARFFAVDISGKVIAPAGVSEAAYKGIAVAGATNVDWEDMILEGRNLVISDMGNNGNKRRNLGVYVIGEPDPHKDSTARLKLHIPIAYPDQKEFPPKGEYRWDCEALFSFRGKLYFVAKDRINRAIPGLRATLYRLDSRDPSKTNVLTKVDEKMLDGWVTSASLSPDGRTLAVLTQFPSQSVWFFPTSSRDDHFLSSPARKFTFTGGKQCEGLCWDDAKTLIVTNEQGDLYRVRASDAVAVGG